MKKIVQNSTFVSLLLLLFFIGCRQDIMLQNEEKFDANASKFKIVKLKDIPQVAKFIRQKTGRNDNLMPLKMGNDFAKGEIDYANLETSLIVQNTEGNDTFYTFQITNAGDDKTFYNLEVKEVEGTLADARVIEYASSIAFGNNPIAVLDNFTGTVKAFGMDGNLKSGISFTYGEGPCDDTPTTPGTGTGNPVAGGSDGGPIFGNPINPPGANTPPDLGPSLPYGPSYPSGGDGSGDGDENLIPSEGCANPNSYVQIGTVSGIPVYQNDCGWVRFGTTSYAAKSISKLKPGCDDDGSGVILLPGGSPQEDTPCNKLKNLLNPNKADLKPLITGGMYDYINNSSTGEGGIYLKNDSNGNLTSEVAPYSGNASLNIKAGGQYYCAVHTHPNTAYPMFSFSDIWSLYILNENLASYNENKASLLLVCTDEFGIKQTYAIVFEDVGQLIDEIIGNPENIGCSEEEFVKRNDEKLKQIYDAEALQPIPNYERAFMRFLIGSNVGLYKANSTLTNFSKLTINSDTPMAVVQSNSCN